MDLSLLSAIDWRQPVSQQYDIHVHVGVTGYVDSSSRMCSSAADYCKNCVPLGTDITE